MFLLIGDVQQLVSLLSTWFLLSSVECSRTFLGLFICYVTMCCYAV